MRHGAICGFLLGLSAFSLAAAAERGPVLSRDLMDRVAAGSALEEVDVIIQGEPDVLREVQSNLGAGRRLGFGRGLAARMSLSEIADLAAIPGITRVSPDRPVISTIVTGDTGGIPWAVWPTPSLSADGVGVAVIDSGIADHPDLPPGTVRLRVDFVPRGADKSDPYGHGTHVAGTIAARSQGRFHGVAPGAHLVSLRVLDAHGRGRASDVIAALDWCIAHAEEYGLRVVNISLGQPAGEPFASDPLAQAVERAWRSGLVVVVSAGNTGAAGFGTISSPGHDPLAVTVGALDDQGTSGRLDDGVAIFSSRGPTRFDFTVKPDLVAPGVSIVSLRVPHSTLDREMPQARVSLDGFDRAPQYMSMSGSSMAAAIASGAAAMLIARDPTLTPDDVKARLMGGADHELSGDIQARGAGSLDLSSAFALEGRAFAARSPRVVENDGTVSVQHDPSAWGDPEVWSLEDLYGEPSLWEEEAPLAYAFFDDPCMTGQGVVWQTMTGTGAVWQTMVAQGAVWQTMTGSGAVWQTLSGHGAVWQTLSGQGAVWQTLAGLTCKY